MRLLDTYALATASKIEKPFVYEQYFPLVHENYITFQAQTRFDSKDYSYWQDVINLLFPILEKNNIKIIQVGGQNEAPYQYTVDLRGKTEIAQLAYLIKNSRAHLGPDSLGIHIASTYDTPIVGLYSAIQSSVSGPHFGSKDKQILFDAYLRAKNGKPSYADRESPKSIDLIKPEEVANAICKILNIDFKVPFETVYIGERYSSKIIREFIPIKPMQVLGPDFPIEIRMDLHFDEKVLAEQLTLNKALIYTNKRIEKNLLNHFKPNIVALVYDVTENDEPKFIDDIKDLGINIALTSRMTPEQVQDKKIDYYNFGKIEELKREPEEKINEFRTVLDSLFFKSNKVMAADGKAYMGNAMRLSNQEIINDFNYHRAVDIPEFWQDLPFITLVKKI